MKKTIKSLISAILVICMLASSVVTIFAYSEEEYLSDLRLIYADDYEEAKLILSETKLEGFEILNKNLNSNTGETGVWLAYKTTTDINDAITDIAVMNMGGGYSTGNYRALIEKKRLEYLAMGKVYLEAIKYFAKAYRAGDFLAEAAYRQLNFYVGLDDYTSRRLGYLMERGVLDASDLAT